MGKWELTMDPVQEWGEEVEDGAVFGITLRRERVQQSGEVAEASPCSAYVQYRTAKVRRLKAATLKRVVDHLFDPCCQEQDYGRILLSTYRTFISTKKLIELLFQRTMGEYFFQHTALSSALKAHRAAFPEDYGRILLSTYRTFISTKKLIELLFQRDKIHFTVDNSKLHESTIWTLLQNWLDEFAEDFWDPPMHFSLRLMCLQLKQHESLSVMAKCYDDLLKKFQAEDAVNKDESSGEQESESPQEQKDLDDVTNQKDFLEFSDKEVAEQLTRQDAELFVKVVPFQCLGCVWSQRDKKENLSPTIRATISQFNAVTNRVITSVLCPSSSTSPTPSSSQNQRARIIEKWIQVAQECKQLKNFSSLKAILSALQSNPIYRLRTTWDAVSRESVSTFENLCETFPDENCVLTSRESLEEDGNQADTDNILPKTAKQCPLSKQMGPNNGVVPYLGTFLTVLTMLDTALPDTMECDFINFEKRRREYEVLWQIRQLQASCAQYTLPNQPQIAAWLQQHELLTDQESYELSRQLEPPLDSCSPSNNTASNHRSLAKMLTSLLNVTDSSKKNADEISVSSSGSSSSEMEDLSTNQSSPLEAKCLSSSCQNMADSTSSSSPTGSSSSSTSSQADLILALPTTFSTPSKSGHKRSVSMTALPLYNRQMADCCIIRISIESGNNGNMYKSILVTSQEKTAQVIERALQKHNLDNASVQDFNLVQLLPQGKELIIPDKATSSTPCLQQPTMTLFYVSVRKASGNNSRAGIHVTRAVSEMTSLWKTN